MEQPSRTFEDSFGRLQEAIERLEEGGLPLDQALDLFEQGIGLAADCHKILDRAELRLTRLVQEYTEALEGADEA